MQTFEISSNEELTAGMKALSASNKGCWAADVVFGKVFAVHYACPSRIPVEVVGDCSPRSRGYWQGGKFHPFSAAKLAEYGNYCLTKD